MEQSAMPTHFKDSNILSYLPGLVFEERENKFGYILNKETGKTVRLNPHMFLVFKLCRGFPVGVALKAYRMEMVTKLPDNNTDQEMSFFTTLTALLESGLVYISSEEGTKERMDYNTVKINVTNAYIELTSLCNAFCPYCYNRSGADGKHMDSALLFHLLKQVVEMDIGSITISGGEPTLHPDFIRVIEFCKRNDLKTNVITNAWFHDSPKIIEALADCNVQFTLDHIIPELHDSVKGKGNFIAVEKAMRALSMNDSAGHRKLRVNLSKANERYVDAFVQKGGELQAHVVEFQFLHRLGRDIEYDDHIDYNENPELAEEIIRKLEIMRSRIPLDGSPQIVLSGCLPTNSCNFLTVRDNRLNCMIRVTAEGTVFPCQFFSAPYFSLGNIKEKTLREIIHSNHLYDLLEMLNFRSTHNSSCDACVWDRMCRKGCPAKTYTIYSTIWQKSGECSIWKHMHELRLQNSSIVQNRQQVR